MIEIVASWFGGFIGGMIVGIWIHQWATRKDGETNVVKCPCGCSHIGDDVCWDPDCELMKDYQ